jgi:preprotein translocase subunit SecA
MAPVYHFMGMTTGVIVHDAAYIYDPEYSDDSQYDDRLKSFKPVTRRDAYACDITYGTNNEFGFDYLRDNMVPGLDRTVQRDLAYAIVDEVDSILIDEARTPLIISAPAEESTDKYGKFARLVTRLKENDDYNIDEKMRAATLTEGGIARMEKWLGVENIYTTGGIREVHHIEQALKAHTLFKRDRDYVVREGEVIIVDEFTGRLMHGRRYSEGLHQAIEAKEGVAIQRESQTLATITFQNYFRMYDKLSGMTGTAVTEAEEFSKIYDLETMVIPTHKPMIRDDKNDLIYRTEQGKFKAVIAEVKHRSEKGQPVLIGTISIEKNEILAAMMEREGLKPNVLNAKNHEKEARFIAEAGKTGAVTIATNMAGRGVDIMLGGREPSFFGTSGGDLTKESEEHEEWQKEHDRVVAAGGLHVIGTERHESRRIDNQLRGRAGRQGDPGSSRFYVSTEDDLMRIFGGDRMKNMMATLRVPEDMPIENKLISKSIESAQHKVEGHNFDIRKHLVEYDDVINKHREAIYKRRREILETAQQQQPEGKDEEGDSKSRMQSDEKKDNSLSDITLGMVEAEIEQVVSFHTAAERIGDWDLDEICQVISTIFPVENKLNDKIASFAEDTPKLDKVKARTAIIEYLAGVAQNNYSQLEDSAIKGGINWPEVEKSVLIRSIDTLWIEHLEAMSSLRQGIGLRGYGQRDPLVEYKKEAYRLFNELNGFIQKEVVYGIYKIGGTLTTARSREFSAPSLADRARQFKAPSKVMDSSTASFSGFKQPGAEQASGTGPSPTAAAPESKEGDLVRPKAKDASGRKIGRNDPCPCASGKKYKKCHGR